MDIAAWLQNLGLGEYADTFRTHAIDVEILTDLTESDFEKIGIPLGHRKRLIRAIAALRSTPSAQAESMASPALAREEGERRQMTVAFCDLVGSTALLSHLDPEDIRDVMGAYHGCVTETVQRFNGYVGRYMDDGVLIYFGYPSAHEDDADRAVLAALELLTTIRALRPIPDVDLHARIGIATGLVVVSDLLARTEVRERYAVGETMNLAARLQAIAEPDTVVIDHRTKRLVGDLFVYHDLGRVNLKGIREPTPAWQVLLPSETDNRFEALHSMRLSPLIGRDDELEILRLHWQRAKSGHGQVILIQGEPGIGKSRIVATFLEEMTDDQHSISRYFCSPQHGHSALYPILRQFERAAGFNRHDDRDTKIRKLKSLFSAESILNEDRMLLTDLVLGTLHKSSLPPAISPQQAKKNAFEALIRQFEFSVRQFPAVIVFEDAHWADPTSLELLDLVVERIHEMSALIVVTFRPDFSSSLTGQPNVRLLNLSRLDRDESSALVDRIAENTNLPNELLEEIVDRAGGVPFFIEELTKAVLEDAVGSDCGCKDGRPFATESIERIPATLSALLTDRIDRLGDAKEVAQIGASLGREFSHELIAAVAECSEDALNSALDQLRRAGVIFRRGRPPYASYLFKHALLQEAAYGMLLRKRRQQLHVRIAQVLEDQFNETGDTQLELIAHHFAEAGISDKAADYWGLAGKKSVSRSALKEAIAQFRMALAELAKVPSNSSIRRKQLELQVALAGTLVHIKGYAAPEVTVALEEARLLAERGEPATRPLEDPLLQFSIMYGLWVARYVAVDVNMMRSVASQFLTQAERQPLSAPRLVGHRLMGTSLLMHGEFLAAKRHLDQAVALYHPEEHRPIAVRFSQDIGVSALAFRSWTLWHLGHPAAAIADADELLRCARELDQVQTIAYGLFHAAVPNILCGFLTLAETQIAELLSLVERHGLLFWRTLGQFLQGWTMSAKGQGQQASKVLREAFSEYDSTNSTLFSPLFYGVLASALAQQGKLDEAAEHVAKALALTQHTNERWSESELHRIAGSVQLLENNEAGAETCFDTGLSIARTQQAKSYELRTASSLARLWLKQGKVCEATELLASIYGWFDQGFRTRDLDEARELLDLKALS
jgi:class 3 adenylate cyclase/predicted ATPase